MGIADSFAGILGYIFSGALLYYTVTFLNKALKYRDFTLFPGVRIYVAWYIASIMPIVIYFTLILLSPLNIESYPYFYDFVGDHQGKTIVDDHVSRNATIFNFFISSLVTCYLLAALFLPRDAYLYFKKSQELKLDRKEAREIILDTQTDTWSGFFITFVSIIITSSIWSFGVYSAIFKDPFSCYHISSTGNSAFLIGYGICSTGYVLFMIPMVSAFFFFFIPFVPLILISIVKETFAKDMPLRQKNK